MDLNVENYGIALRDYSVNGITRYYSENGILKIHGTAPEYKYYGVFLE